MKSLKGFLAVLFVLICTAIRAEGGCPDGEYPQQGPGWRTCVPIPGASNETQTRPAFRWKSNWGAIAADKATASLGTTTTASSEDDAEQAAIKDCKARGGSRCEILITVQNACMAMVVGATRLNAKVGSTKSEAEGRGMALCNQQDTNCAVYYSACSVPERLTY